MIKITENTTTVSSDKEWRMIDRSHQHVPTKTTVQKSTIDVVSQNKENYVAKKKKISKQTQYIAKNLLTVCQDMVENVGLARSCQKNKGYGFQPSKHNHSPSA